MLARGRAHAEGHFGTERDSSGRRGTVRDGERGGSGQSGALEEAQGRSGTGRARERGTLQD
eukprot:3939853-Rhodomonas_salina.1